jgi:uncharacterized surface protein with fasciclin (FAS1) repeats
MARFAAVLAATALLALSATSVQAHEIEGCSFPANISARANLTVAGQALTALGGSDLFASHGTVFLPTDAAFTALVTALDVTPADLLGDDLVNTTVAILAYHYLSEHMYTEAELLGNMTVQTGLGELASEASGTNVSLPLRFRTPSGAAAVDTQAGGSTSDGEVTPVEIVGVNSTADIVQDLGDVCNRQVYVIDAVLIPVRDLADAPQTIPAAVSARVAAAEAEEAAEEADAPAPAAESDGDEASAPATAPAPQAAHPAAKSGALLAGGLLGASLLLHAL